MTSVDQLVERLAAEVAAATDRIHSLQTEAARVFLGQERRFLRFAGLTERIHAILQPRIEAFTKVNVFKDVEPNVSLKRRGPEERGFHGRTTTLSVPSSDACSGKVELSFHLGHDGPIENAIIDYRLEILPISESVCRGKKGTPAAHVSLLRKRVVTGVRKSPVGVC